MKTIDATNQRYYVDELPRTCCKCEFRHKENQTCVEKSVSGGDVSVINEVRVCFITGTRYGIGGRNGDCPLVLHDCGKNAKIKVIDTEGEL
jgi:hypothetical protein